MNPSRSTEPTIMTARLDLVHLSVVEIVTLFENPSDPLLFVEREFSNPYRILMDDPGPLGWRVPQVKVDPSVNKWFVRMMVLRETGQVVGSTSFHGPPDEAGMIEIGLEVEPSHRRIGLATEALTGMWSWVVRDPSVQILRYTVAIDNEPSIGLVEKFGFEKVGRQIDDVDGPEDIYEMSAAEFTRRFAGN